jgi:hypothetical protein
MKYNIIALRTIYSDGPHLYGDARFIEGDTTTEVIALAVVTRDALSYFNHRDIQQVSICWCKAEWNFEVTESSIYKEIMVTPLDCIKALENFNVYDYIPEITGKVLQVLPDSCYNTPLYKKLRKIRKNGKCIDWTKQNHLVECDNAGWWYLHGKLEEQVHYDKAMILNCTEAGDTVETLRWWEIRGDKCTSYSDKPYRVMHVNGVRRCNVIGVNGDCLGFFYTEDEREVTYDKGTFTYWKQRGYIVQRNDKDGVLDALHKYLTNSLD